MAFRQRKHPVHRPITERFNEAPIIFLTVCTRNRKRILANSEAVVLLRDSWHQATSWTVGRFIVMPDHLHLFCAPVENITHPLSQWVRYWKTVASRSWPRPQEQPVWQLDFWDTQLRHGMHYDEKWEYVRQNPVRAGLVAEADDWPHRGELTHAATVITMQARSRSRKRRRASLQDGRASVRAGGERIRPATDPPDR